MRTLLLLGVLVRVPMAALGLAITLHVLALGGSYGEAGVATLVYTIGLAVAGPWRGRLLDRLGLRRVVVPALLVQLVVWSIGPRLSYGPLLVAVAVAGLLSIPYPVMRLAVLAAAPAELRRTALSLDSVAVELSFMIGPLLAVWLGTAYGSAGALGAVGLAGVASGLALLVLDPPIRGGPDEAEAPAAVPLRAWFSPQVATVLLATGATGIVLSGTEIGVVAGMRGFGAEGVLGLVLTLWCLGSVIGALVYGAWHRPISAHLLLLALGLVTLPVALAREAIGLGVLVVVAGFLCAPTITATIDQLTRAVPPGNRGEALGWHGSFLMAGVSAGAPVAGFAIDHAGVPAGFVVVGAVGVLVALVGLAARALRRARGRRAAARAGAREAVEPAGAVQAGDRVGTQAAAIGTPAGAADILDS